MSRSISRYQILVKLKENEQTIKRNKNKSHTERAQNNTKCELVSLTFKTKKTICNRSVFVYHFFSAFVFYTRLEISRNIEFIDQTMPVYCQSVLSERNSRIRVIYCKSDCAEK